MVWYIGYIEYVDTTSNKASGNGDPINLTDHSSCAIGKRKPEPEAFEFVAKHIGVNLYEMVFYDDSTENIIGAKRVGLNTVHVRSIEDIEASFDSLIQKSQQRHSPERNRPR